MANSQKKRKGSSASEILDTLQDLTIVEDNWPHFLIIESSNKDRPVTTISPFVIDKTIKGWTGSVKQVRKLRSGVLLVEVATKVQCDYLLKLKSVLDLPVTVSPHRTMNSCKGIIRSYDLAQIDESELLTELGPQGVTEVRPIYVTRDGQKKRTNTSIVTFARSTLPKEITAGYLRIPVQMYYPSPLRCFNCQRFGHHRAALLHVSIQQFAHFAACLTMVRHLVMAQRNAQTVRASMQHSIRRARVGTAKQR